MDITKTEALKPGSLLQLYTTATDSLDVWEGIDNPFTRPRRLEIEEIDISPDEDSIFADAGDDIRIF